MLGYCFIFVGRKNRCDHSKIQRGIVSFDSSRNIEENIFGSQLKASSFFENSQQHIEALGIKTCRASLWCSVYCRAHQRLNFQKHRPVAFEGNGNGVPGKFFRFLGNEDLGRIFNFF